jgi:hypothetical protein
VRHPRFASTIPPVWHELIDGAIYAMIYADGAGKGMQYINGIYMLAGLAPVLSERQMQAHSIFIFCWGQFGVFVGGMVLDTAFCRFPRALHLVIILSYWYQYQRTVHNLSTGDTERGARMK